MISMNDIQDAFDRGEAPFASAIKAVKFIAKSKENTPEKDQSKVYDDFTI